MERQRQNSGEGQGLGLNPFDKANKIRFWKYMVNFNNTV